MTREYHALRVNLTPKQVDELENNHRNLASYIGTLKDQLSEGRLAVATATVEDSDVHHPSVAGTASRYVDTVLATVKRDTSLDAVAYPWSKAKTTGSYALAQAAAHEEALALSNLAAARGSGAKSAPRESRRKRRRRMNHSSSAQQIQRLEEGELQEGVPQTDLTQTFRDVNRNRTMLQDATVRFKPGKKVFKGLLERPSTAPPPKTPYGTLKLLQHVLTYDLTAYKRLPPREIGPGHYDLSAAIPPVVKDPHRPSASFLSPHAHGSGSGAGAGGGGGDTQAHGAHADDDGGNGNAAPFGAPTTFSGRQRAIANILQQQGVGNASPTRLKPLSPFDRLHKGEHARPRVRRLSAVRRGARHGHPLGGGGSFGGGGSAEHLSSIGSSLWEDAFYQETPKPSAGASPLAPLRGSPAAHRKQGGAIDFDNQDLFMRPTSPEFKFPAAKRFSAEKQPHWKGLGSPFNMQKDLACWLQQSVYLDDRVPKGNADAKALRDREEGPRALDASFDSMAKNAIKSPIKYAASFSRDMPRFLADPLVKSAMEQSGRAGELGRADADARWQAAQLRMADDPSRESLSFRTDGHPTDTSLVITMGSQFDEKKPRFRASRALKEQLRALEAVDEGGKEGASTLSATTATTTTTKKTKKKKTATTKQMAATARPPRPSTTVVRGSASLNTLASTV